MRRNFTKFSSETKVRNLFAEFRGSSLSLFLHSTVNVDESIVEIEFKLDRDRDLKSVRNWMQTNQITLNIN